MVEIFLSCEQFERHEILENLSQNQSRSARGMEILIVLRGFVRGTELFLKQTDRAGIRWIRSHM